MREKSQNCKKKHLICEFISHNSDFMSKKKSEMWDHIMQFWKENHNCAITMCNYQNSTFNLQIVRSVIAIHCFPMVKMDHSPSCCITSGFGGFQRCVQPRKNGANFLLNRNGGALNTLFWWRKCCSYGSWEGHSLCYFWIIFCKYTRCYSHCPCRPE